ncbi:MAG: amidotransferase [Saprospiraceae bacterium]|nr:amidotransferase [Saprospiraceae bacterium]
MFQKLLPGLDFVTYDVCHRQFPENLQDCDAYITTGSKFSVYDDLPWIQQLKELVAEIYIRDKYYIGICFGHQMLAEALGGKVAKGSKGWCVGNHAFLIQEKKEWMTPFQDTFNILMSCQDQVKIMPENAQMLAKSKDCEIGMFQVGDKMLGIQGHPEFPKDYSRALMHERSEKIGSERTLLGLESLEEPLHVDVIEKWIRNFLGGH